jgi:hypothetical protein
MFNEVNEGGPIKPERLEKGEHVDRIPEYGGMDIADSLFSKIVEQFAGHGVTYARPHMTRMNHDHLEPPALLQTKSLSLYLTYNESDHLSFFFGDKTDPFLLPKVILHYLLAPSASGILLGDGTVNGNNLGDVLGRQLP